jgi:Leucine-rich repeat (LRR) protein
MLLVEYVPEGSELTTLSLGQTKMTMMDTLPEDFFALRPKLESLDLSETGLTGSPTDQVWAEATSLFILDLSDNGLTGPLSGPLTTLSNLYILILNGNDLSGSLDETSVASFTSLIGLYLARNSFEGELPWVSITTSLTNLEQLVVNGNEFVGSIPTTIDQVVSLKGLNLACNEFTGSLPVELTNLPLLWTLNLEGNNFEGDLSLLPAGSFSTLEELHLNSNDFTGDISPIFCTDLGTSMIPNLRADCPDDVQCDCCRCGMTASCAI